MGVIVTLPDQIKPRPDFDVIRDLSFSEFFDNLRRGMNVQATFEGRFEAVFTSRNRTRILVQGQKQSRGFGKDGQYGGRITLRRISDVLARPKPHR